MFIRRNLANINVKYTFTYISTDSGSDQEKLLMCAPVELSANEFTKIFVEPSSATKIAGARFFPQVSHAAT
jgi:hypothetical protein